MFEHWHARLLPKRLYYLRLAKHAALAFSFIIVGLGIGVLGYHGFEHLPWIDSLLNAAMILGGMGPINALHTVGGKLFASCYALFSGLLFVVTAGVLFAPVIHRFLHHFHAEIGGGDENDTA